MNDMYQTNVGNGRSIENGKNIKISIVVLLIQ